MNTLAKIVCTSKAPVPGSNLDNPEQYQLTFGADYADGRNAEWAPYTPSLSLSMVLKAGVADRYRVGQPLDMTLADATPELLREDAELTGNGSGQALLEAGDEERASGPENDRAMAAAAEQTGAEPVPFTADGKIDVDQIAADAEAQAGTSKTAKRKA